LQQHIAVSKLFVVWNAEMFQQAGYQRLPGPKPGWTKIAISTIIPAHRQNSTPAPAAGFHHADIYRRGLQLPGCGKPAKSSSNNQDVGMFDFDYPRVRVLYY
jgi:hypothetical protein